MRTIGYTLEATEPTTTIPATCRHLHTTAASAAVCHDGPWQRSPRAVPAVMVNGVIVTARGIAAPPIDRTRPIPVHCRRPVHPGEVELDAEARAHLGLALVSA